MREGDGESNGSNDLPKWRIVIVDRNGSQVEAVGRNCPAGSGSTIARGYGRNGGGARWPDQPCGAQSVWRGDSEEAYRSSHTWFSLTTLRRSIS